MLIRNRTYVAAAYSDAGGTVSVTANLGAGWEDLEPGVPAQAALARGAYAYYRLVMTEASAAQVVLTPAAGDADLYVSRNASNPRPTQARHDKASIGGGTSVERVTFGISEMPECVAAFAPGGAGVCALWVGVFGYTTTSFALVGSLNNSDPTAATLLLDGVALAGVLPVGATALYYAPVRVPAGSTYSFYVRALAGDPDLFVSTNGRPASLTPPSNYQFASVAAYGDDFINVAPASPYYNASS